VSLDTKDVERIVYRSLRAAWEKDRGGGIAPPSLIYVTELTQCLLKSWYNRAMGVPPSDEKIVVLLLGDDVHYLINSQFPLGEGEKSFEKEYNGVRIRGRVDRIVGSTILEFKTTSRIPTEPLSHHVDQMQLYFWLTDTEKGFLVYVAKTNGKVRVFEVFRDDEKIKELLEKAVKLSESLKKGEPPEPENSWLCDYCEYKSQCPLHIGSQKA